MDKANATMQATSYVLYDAAGSPASMRVKMWFFEKRMTFSSYLVNLGRMEQKSPAYLALNPAGVVPTLCIGQQAIYDSHVILRYLECRHPSDPRLMPERPDAWFEHERWVCLERDLAASMRPAVYETFAKQRAQALLAEDPDVGRKIQAITGEELFAASFEALCQSPVDQRLVDTAKVQLRPYLQHVERALADGREWLLGEAMSLADLSVGPRLAVLPYIDVEVSPAQWPALAAYLERFRELPSWQAAASCAGAIPFATRLGIG